VSAAQEAEAPAERPDPLDRLCDLSARVVFVPVRHHSPAAAAAVRALIRQLAPAAVLIEGPSDFNPRLEELLLPHRLPIAIYCHARAADGTRRGAYYPFCEYSPEWLALTTARKQGIPARFIDLPFRAAGDDRRANRYADAALRRSPYVDELCARLGVDDFDAAWDELFEVGPLAPADYLRRAHSLCLALRAADVTVDARDQTREAFMAAQILGAMTEFSGRLVVVTGGYHSRALAEQVASGRAVAPEVEDAPGDEAGVALTPYSYERLDRLTGYESGMPGPGFYQRAWRDRARGGFRHHAVIFEVARALRGRGQVLSAADLIGVETTARALATLRGHPQVWRRDIVDGLTAAVLKDELAHGGTHPLLDAIHDVLRGSERGELAAGTSRPPLVVELRVRLEEHDLWPAATRDVELALERGPDRARSAVLHQVRLLRIAGFDRSDGTDFLARDDLSRVWERWHLAWSPDFEATAVEAARYGATLPEAAANVLAERSAALERDAARGAALLFDAAMAGLGAQASALAGRLLELVRADNDFTSVATALRHLLYLHRYDRVLVDRAPAQHPVDLQPLVTETWRRGLWLLEMVGRATTDVEAVTSGVALLVECVEACPEALSRDDLLDTLRRTAADGAQLPALRGAATGGLWTMGATADAELLRAVATFADPAILGDYLSGLFALGRESVQRQPDLLGALDRVLAGYDDDQFLEAVPSLRLAFTYFTPREKHHLSLTLLELWGARPAELLAPLAVDPAAATQAMAFESRLFEAARRYGLRGGGA
jgi:hypothetical protein